MAESYVLNVLEAKEEKDFTKRLERELVKLANEGIVFELPTVVIDHIADTESNLSYVKSVVRRCAREKIKEGEGLNLFKIRRVKVSAEEKGRAIIRTEIMMMVQCKLNDAHHAIYRLLNQKVSTRLRLSVYVFDVDGCKYPDRSYRLPLDIQQIKNALRINTAIKNPVYIDVKEDREREEERQHVKKVNGGYPIEKLVGTADTPIYRKFTTTKAPVILSTRDEPYGSLLGERNEARNLSNPVNSMTHPKITTISKQTNASKASSSTPDPRSRWLVGEKSNSSSNSNNKAPKSASKKHINVQELQNNSRSVNFEKHPDITTQDRRVFIDNAFYSETSSVFRRLGTQPASKHDAVNPKAIQLPTQSNSSSKGSSTERYGSVGMNENAQNPDTRYHDSRNQRQQAPHYNPYHLKDCKSRETRERYEKYPESQKRGNKEEQGPSKRAHTEQLNQLNQVTIKEEVCCYVNEITSFH